jgi:hypothetical protein
MHSDPQVARVWPSPPAGSTYVTQTLTGGDYTSTGQFPVHAVDAAGRGRTVDNVARVTSLFFDADLLTLFDAAREAKGAVLEPRAADRKRRLYQAPDAVVTGFKALLRDEFLPVLEALVGAPPTLVVDSGWGFHVHFALEADVGERVEPLRALMQALLREANRRAADVALTLRPQLQVSATFDATFDVGARLARIPGTLNLKAPGKVREVEVVSSSRTVLDTEVIARLQQQFVTPEEAPSDPNSVPQVSRPTETTTVQADFRAMRLVDGRTWQQVVEALAPGERLKVVCPFGGTTVGSGFFALEADGRARYWSGPTSTTYWNTHQTQVQRPGLATLVRDPGRNGAPGRIQNTVTNLTTMLEHDDTFDLWYDAFAQREMDGTTMVDDRVWVNVVSHMEAAYDWRWRVGRELLFSTVEAVARQRSRNPVVDYLNSIRWDGCDRAHRWLSEVLRIEQTDLLKAYSLRWCIGLVARALQPGCKLDTSLVLTGPQGFGKSTIFREWMNLPGLGDELFSDTRFNLKDKDSYLQLHSCWLYEDAELAGSSTADQETRKAFLASAMDRIRPPFGRKVRTYRRHTVVVGTTNEQEFLRDRSGSRRYWVVEVPGHPDGANLEWLRDWRGQILAEAVVRYSRGEQWWLTPEESALQRKGNRDYEWRDWYTECAEVARLANAGGWAHRFTVAQFSQAIDTRINPQQKGLSLAAALRRAGFQKKRSGGVTYYFADNNNPRGRGDGLHAVEAVNRANVADIRSRYAE